MYIFFGSCCKYKIVCFSFKDFRQQSLIRKHQNMEFEIRKQKRNTESNIYDRKF